MNTPTQQQWREMLRRVLGAWVAETAGETLDNETYDAAERMIEESEAAEGGKE